ncbi:phage tail protein [Ectopseudomonas khazarica]|uniref:phage tail protein n=1 Tax=Ectopseudomonas khazarica TaxID=2502979 RepID=UPI0038515E8D
MQRYYSQETGNTYLQGIHQVPAGAVPITEAKYQEVIANPAPGKIRSHDANGLPILIDPPAYAPSVDDLCNRIDTAADAARRAVAGDPLRAVEYDRARLAAEQFAAADYQGEVPAMVAAWAINGRTAQQAADSILAEAAAYTHALELLRTTRLAAKEQIRTLMAANQAAQAQQVANQTIASIEAAVAGIGNNS